MKDDDSSWIKKQRSQAKWKERQRNRMSDCGQPETIALHLTRTLCSLGCSLGEFKPIFSQEKKGSLTSGSAPTYSPLCSLTVAPLQRVQSNSNDSEEQGDRASPEAFIFLAKLVWQKINVIGGTNSTDPLFKVWLHIFSLRIFSPPLGDFPVALKAGSGDGQIEYDW